MHGDDQFINLKASVEKMVLAITSSFPDASTGGEDASPGHQ